MLAKTYGLNSHPLSLIKCNHRDDRAWNDASAVVDEIQAMAKIPVEVQLQQIIATARQKLPWICELLDRAGGVPTSCAFDIWVEKLGFLRKQEAIVADPAQKFALKKQIEEAESKIRDLQGR